MKDNFLLPDNETIQISNIYGIGKIMISENPSQNFMGFTITFTDKNVKNIFIQFTNEDKLHVNIELQRLRNILINLMTEYKKN